MPKNIERIFTVMMVLVTITVGYCSLVIIAGQENSTLVAKAADYGLDKLPKSLPSGDPTTYITNIINAVTGVLAIILVAMLIYGGATYLTSAGNDERVGTAKKVITYAIIGIAVVAAARIIAEFVIGAVTTTTKPTQ